MKYAISKQREIILTRNQTTGDWTGEGHGYCILVKPKYGRVLYGQRWRCRVSGSEPPHRHILAVCEGHTLKWTLQEGVRLADLRLEDADTERDALLAIARVAGRVDAQLPAVKDPQGAWRKAQTDSVQYRDVFVREYSAAFDGVRAQVLATKHPFHCDCNDCEWFRAEHGS